MKETSKLQQEREDNEKIVQKCTEKIKQISSDRNLLISNSGFLALSKNVFQFSGKLLEEKRTKGDLPYKIKEQFINDILAEGICICGRDIHEHSPEYEHVSSFRKNAGNLDIESEFSLTSSACMQIDKKYSDFYERLSELDEMQNEHEDRREEAKELLDELSYKIKNVDQEDVATLEKKRMMLNKELADLGDKIGYYKGKIKETETKLKDIKKKREDLEDKEAKTGNYHLCLVITDKLQEIVSEFYESLANEVRMALSNKVNKIFKDIIRKPYSAEIDEDYFLQIYKELDGGSKIKIIEKSTGENQVTSLSFIGSIISHAKEKHSETARYYKGGLYPLIMDSPFGALDKDYREQISRYIPELAEQVIILVSNSQWEGTVEEQCKSRIGEEWELKYLSPEINPEDETHYVKSSSDKEYTIIERI